MTRYILATAIAALIGAFSCNAHAQNSSNPSREDAVEEVFPNLELAREVIDLAYPREGRITMMEGAMDSMMSQMLEAMLSSNEKFQKAASDPKLVAIFNKHILESKNKMLQLLEEEHLDSLFGSYAFAYARIFSRQELLDIKSFVSTETGRTFLTKAVGLLSDPDVATANQAYLVDVNGVVEEMEAAMGAELSEYLDANRDAETLESVS